MITYHTRMALPGPRSPIALARFARASTRDPRAALLALQRDHGDVVQVVPAPRRVVGLFGTDANELILSEHPEWFEWGSAMQALVPVDGPTALVVTDGAPHDRRRRMVQPGFHRRRIDGYVALMRDEADRTIDELTRASEIEAYAVFRRTIRRTVVLALFGRELQQRADEFGDLLEPAFDFVNRPPQRQVKLPWPGSGYRRALAARAAADRLIDAEIDRRTAAGADDDGDDVLTELLAARDEAGDGLSRAELRDQIVSLIAAGYDTTSAALAWAIDHVLREPGVLGALRAELDTVVGDAPLTYEHLRSLRYLHGVVQETLRLDPPGVVAPRTALRDFEFRGHRIPAGTMVLYSAFLTGRDPRVWRDPEAFRPGRWIEGDPDREDPGPAASVAFGGGPRRCLGLVLATTELSVLLAGFVRRVDAELVDPRPPTGTGIASVWPRGGVCVRIRSVRPAATAPVA